MSYLTAAQYETITDRPPAEATASRLKRASMLLDARIGNYVPDSDTGWKLDLDDLPLYQENAVKEWVAQMVSFLYDNGDVAVSSSSISLGRFSVTEHGQRSRTLPEAVNFADSLLVSSGLIKRGVRVV